ncbi:MAG: FadR family transcriptional regulator [Chloroflexi bacterium]|jgi:GntR family transcriptional regulator, transcriptional repressor for pyruvate dehydrogenase complex|nr:FadR family transcriptional regulator [Chloroflexota bacterium]MBT6835448.1 FadR family transcriptional regulator [Bacteroidota bacterium]MBT4754804.1 FadR family transcriptional regulator [Chloroflexota bacterium]MBT6358370.1 FadR family transcriptional regulator [Chloroflexota bacterium]MBT6989897.1 FadR family transcriptional regulator [Chloroflexota bacterium]
MYKEVHVGRLYEKIVAQIEKRILDGDLNPGDQLPSERELGQQFGVSRTSIREAIRVLTLKNLVEVNHGRGTFVTEPTSRTLRYTFDKIVDLARQEGSGHLIEIREIIEPEIAALAAENSSEENIAVLRDAVHTMEISKDDPALWEDYVEADLDFHLSLAEGSGNPLFLVLIDLFVVQLRGQRRRAARKEGGLYRGQTHHWKILEAVENKDAETARKLMCNHIQQIREDIK